VIYGYRVVVSRFFLAIRQRFLSPESFYLVACLWGWVQAMSVSVSAVQLRILVAAIVVVTVGQLVVVSIGDGRAASRASIAEPLTRTFTAAHGQSEQPPTRLHAGGPSVGSSCTPFQSANARSAVGRACKGALPVAPSVLTVEDEEVLRLRSVNTMPASLLFRLN